MMARTLASALLLVAGCANNVASNAEYDDVAQMLGAGLATSAGGGELATFTDAAILARGGMPAGISPSGGMMFGDHGDMAYRYLVACSNATGGAVTCGPGAASANVVAEWSGTQHATNCDMTVDRNASWNLDALASPVASVAGSSTLVADAMFRTEAGVMMSSYHVSAHEDATMQLDMAGPAVAGGLLHLTLDVVHEQRDMHGTDHESLSMHGHLMFDGVGCTLVLDETHAYTVDLANGVVTRAPNR